MKFVNTLIKDCKIPKSATVEINLVCDWKNSAPLMVKSLPLSRTKAEENNEHEKPGIASRTLE